MEDNSIGLCLDFGHIFDEVRVVVRVGEGSQNGFSIKLLFLLAFRVVAFTLFVTKLMQSGILDMLLLLLVSHCSSYRDLGLRNVKHSALFEVVSLVFGLRFRICLTILLVESVEPVLLLGDELISRFLDHLLLFFHFCDTWNGRDLLKIT